MLGRAFFRGFMRPVRAAGFLLRNRGLKRFAMMPAIISFLLYAVTFTVAAYFIVTRKNYVFEWDFWWGVGGWLSSIVNKVTDVFMIAVMLLVGFFTFTTFTMVIASPINDILSERIERTLCGERNKDSLGLRQNIRATVYSVLDSLRIVAWQVFFTAVLLLPSLLIPVVGPLALFFLNAYYMGMGFFDVGMARNLLRHKHKKNVIREKRMEMFGMGVAMQFMLMIPFFGILALPIGVAAGTLLYCDCDWAKSFSDNGLEPPPDFQPPIRKDMQKEESDTTGEGA